MLAVIEILGHDIDDQIPLKPYRYLHVLIIDFIGFDMKTAFFSANPARMRKKAEKFFWGDFFLSTGRIMESCQKLAIA